MLINVKKTWKDFVEGPAHQGVTRRDLLKRGLATAALSVTLPKFVLGELAQQAFAASGPSSCPPAAMNPGCIAQIYAQGGPTMGARFISEQQAASASALLFENFGVSGSTFLKLGHNLVIDSKSPFGYTLLQGPPGYPGGPAAWKTNVLSRISGGGHMGPFSQDDGAGQNTGLLGAVSPFKASAMGCDIQIGAVDQLANWAVQSSSRRVSANTTIPISDLSPTSVASVFSLPNGTSALTTTQELLNASAASGDLAQAYNSIFKTATRKDGANVLTSATCSFYGNAALASSGYGLTLFDPTNLSALANKMTLTSLSPEEQAQVAAFYQSAIGRAGGVVLEFGARDYHGQSAQTVIAPADIEEARAVVMWLAACDAAGEKGVLIYLANGQASAQGTTAVTATINGTQANLLAPNAASDGGGAYNAGLAIFYDPKVAPPLANFTGTVQLASSQLTTSASPLVGSSQEAVAGLYLSAFSFMNGGNLPASALAAMQASGVASQPANIMLF